MPTVDTDDHPLLANFRPRIAMAIADFERAQKELWAAKRVWEELISEYKRSIVALFERQLIANNLGLCTLCCVNHVVPVGDLDLYFCESVGAGRSVRLIYRGCGRELRKVKCKVSETQAIELMQERGAEDEYSVAKVLPPHNVHMIPREFVERFGLPSYQHFPLPSLR